VLDIGCGWGALLGYLHDDCAVRHVAGLTLSSDQAATARAARPYADVRLEAWRDHQPDKPYDAIISIGAFEHFSRRELAVDQRRRIYTDFFDRCASWLVEGGRLSLQTIAYEDFDPSTDIETSFFDDVFPESTLPYLSDVVVAAEPAFRVVALRADPAHYEHTLRLWQQRLEAHKDQAIALVGRDTYRHYLRYLRVSRALFERRVTTLYRVVLERRALRHRDNDARDDV
jgi:cyclopropane-fatty-acyl-phospholipid synthase